jgi:hypothetical protein
VAVLDCLTDAVLTQCAAAPAEMKRRLIETVDSGASRPKELSVPQVPACQPDSLQKMCFKCGQKTAAAHAAAGTST